MRSSRRRINKSVLNKGDRTERKIESHQKYFTSVAREVLSRIPEGGKRKKKKALIEKARNSVLFDKQGKRKKHPYEKKLKQKCEKTKREES